MWFSNVKPKGYLQSTERAPSMVRLICFLGEET